MILINRIVVLIGITVAFSCGETKNNDKEKFSYKRKQTSSIVKKEANIDDKKSELPASKIIDLTNKGVGPISSIALSNKIDANMVSNGAELFKKLCTACHKIGKKFIGPAPNNIFDRRTPEWVMNMIINPEEMVKKDPLAKQLLIEFNGAPMANQNLDEDQARAIVEYFRTLN